MEGRMTQATHRGAGGERSAADISAVVYPSTLNQDACALRARWMRPTTSRAWSMARACRYPARGSYNRFPCTHFDNGATWVPSIACSDTSKPVRRHPLRDSREACRPGVGPCCSNADSQRIDRRCVQRERLRTAVRMEADYAPIQGGGRPIDVTLRWKEVRLDRSLVERSFRQNVTTFPTTVTIDVGGSDHPVSGIAEGQRRGSLRSDAGRLQRRARRWAEAV